VDSLKPLTATVLDDPVTIVVHRKRVLRSAMSAMSHARFSFQRRVLVEFSGEDALDEGGPRREFFRLIIYIYV